MKKDHVIEIVVKHWEKNSNKFKSSFLFPQTFIVYFILFLFMKSTIAVAPFFTIQMIHSVYIVAQLASNFTIHYSLFHSILLNKRLLRLFQLDNYTLLFRATFDNNRLHVINYYYYYNVRILMQKRGRRIQTHTFIAHLVFVYVIIERTKQIYFLNF